MKSQHARTLAECGEELGVSWRTVKSWIEAGKLAAFMPPGKALVSESPGPKGLRILAADWERFLRANTVTGQVAVEVAPEPATKPTTTTTGTDGKRRSKRKY